MVSQSRLGGDAEFRQRVLEALDSLPPQQQIVAEHLLDHLGEAPFLSVPELAERTGASEATIVRFAQRLGYTGYADLKSDLLGSLRQQLFSRPSGTVRAAVESADEPPGEDTLSAVARLESSNIARTIDEMDRAAFGEAAMMLLRADHVYTFGLGVSAHLAALLAYFLVQIGGRANALSTGFSSPLEQTVSFRPTDLVVGVSFPPYSRATIRLLEGAAERGTPTLAITDRPSAPGALVAKLALIVRSENMMFTNAIAAASVVLNALATEIALRDRQNAARAVDRISRILATDPDVSEAGP